MITDYKIIQLSNSQAIKLAAKAFGNLDVLKEYNDFVFKQDQASKTSFVVDAVHPILKRMTAKIDNYFL